MSTRRLQKYADRAHEKPWIESLNPGLDELTGHEQPPENTAKTPSEGTAGAESGAVAAQHGDIDAQLALLVQAWPALPDEVKAAILRQVASVV